MGRMGYRGAQEEVHRHYKRFGDRELLKFCVRYFGQVKTTDLGKKLQQARIWDQWERIAGKNLANPLATILSLAMLLRYSLREFEHAERIEAAVGEVLDQGLRTADIAGAADSVGTKEMGMAVVTALRNAASS